MKEIKITGYCGYANVLKNKFRWNKYTKFLFVDDLPYITKKKSNSDDVKIEIIIREKK